MFDKLGEVLKDHFSLMQTRLIPRAEYSCCNFSSDLGTFPFFVILLSIVSTSNGSAAAKITASISFSKSVSLEGNLTTLSFVIFAFFFHIVARCRHWRQPRANREAKGLAALPRPRPLGRFNSLRLQRRREDREKPAEEPTTDPITGPPVAAECGRHRHAEEHRRRDAVTVARFTRWFIIGTCRKTPDLVASVHESKNGRRRAGRQRRV